MITVYYAYVFISLEWQPVAEHFLSSTDELTVFCLTDSSLYIIHPAYAA